MAKQEELEDQQRLRKIRLMSPFPARPFEAFQGPPIEEGSLIAKVPILEVPFNESKLFLHKVMEKYNRRVIARVDCAFDPYSEERITATVDLQALESRTKLVSLNDGPLIFMSRFHLSKNERSNLPYRRSKKASSTTFSCDGNQIAWPGYTHYTLYDHCSEKRRLVTSYDEILCGSFSPDGVLLALLSVDESRLHLRIIDSKTLKIVAGGFGCPELFSDNESTSLENYPLHISWSKCARYLAMTTYNEELILFNAKLMIDCKGFVGMPLPILKHHEDLASIAGPKAYDFSMRKPGTLINPDITTLALGTLDNTILLYEVTDAGLGQLINEMDVANDENISVINCLKFSNSQEILAVAMSTGTIDLFDNDSLLPVRSLSPAKLVTQLPKRMPYYHGFCCLSFSCTDNFLAAGATDGQLRIWCLKRPIGPLKALCRTTIRSHCKLDDMSRLPLPQNLVSYLTDISF